MADLNDRKAVGRVEAVLRSDANLTLLVNIASIVGVAPEILNGVYGGIKAFVLALSRSQRHELAGTGVRVQVVLPGATAAAFWNIAGTQVENLPKEQRERVMSAEDMVDAALAGLDQDEFVTIPALPNAADWDAFEAAREALPSNLSRATPAERYKIKAHGVGAAAQYPGGAPGVTIVERPR